MVWGSPSKGGASRTAALHRRGGGGGSKARCLPEGPCTAVQNLRLRAMTEAWLEPTVRKRLHFLSRSMVSLFYNSLLSTHTVPQAGLLRHSQRACHKQASSSPYSAFVENLWNPHTKRKTTHTERKSNYFAGARGEEKLIVLSKPTTKGWPFYLPRPESPVCFQHLPWAIISGEWTCL